MNSIKDIKLNGTKDIKFLYSKRNKSADTNKSFSTFNIFNHEENSSSSIDSSSDEDNKTQEASNGFTEKSYLDSSYQSPKKLSKKANFALKIPDIKKNTYFDEDAHKNKSDMFNSNFHSNKISFPKFDEDTDDNGNEDANDNGNDIVQKSKTLNCDKIRFPGITKDSKDFENTFFAPVFQDGYSLKRQSGYIETTEQNSEYYDIPIKKRSYGFCQEYISENNEPKRDFRKKNTNERCEIDYKNSNEFSDIERKSTNDTDIIKFDDYLTGFDYTDKCFDQSNVGEIPTLTSNAE